MQHSLKGLMARNRWILSVAVFLLTVVALVSLVEARKIRVGIASVGIPAILYLISRENGYYQQEGLDVEIIVMESTLANAGVIAGDLDFSTIPVAGTIAAVRGAPLVNVFASYDRPQHAIVSKPEIRRPEDLKGKRVAILRIKSLDDLLLRAVLEQKGLRIPQDVTVLGVGAPPTRYAALVSGRVDAAVMAPPFNFAAEKDGFRQILFFKDYGLVLISGGAVVRKAVLQSDRQMVKKFLRAVMKAMIHMREDRSGSIRLMAKIIRVDENLATRMYDFAHPTLAADGVLNRANQETFMKVVLEFAEKEVSPPVENFFDYSVAREVAAELKADGWKP